MIKPVVVLGPKGLTAVFAVLRCVCRSQLILHGDKELDSGFSMCYILKKRSTEATCPV